MAAPPTDTLPLGPRRPVALQSLRWAARPQRFLDSCRRRYGDAFTVTIQGGRWVFLSHPRDAAAIYAGDPDAFAAGETHDLLEPLFGRRSVHLLDGPEHLRQRRLLAPPLHGEGLEHYAATIAAVTAEAVAGWPEKEMQLLPRTRAITLEVIMRGIFGFKRAGDGRAVRDSLDRVLHLTMGTGRVIGGALLPARLLQPATGSRLFAFRRAMNSLETALLAEIRARRRAAGVPGADLLSMLVGTTCEDGSPLDDEELKDNLVTLVVAGHETTATGLAWALHSLARSPEALAEVPGALADAEWLDSLVRETLRLHPPVPLSMRRLLRPLRLGGAELPPGTNVAVCIPLLHRFGDAYEEPERFLPGRFRGWRPPAHAWAPFGGGTRRCLGSRVAMLEMGLVLRAVLERRRLEPSRTPAEAVSSLAMRPARGGRVTLRRR